MRGEVNELCLAGGETDGGGAEAVDFGERTSLPGLVQRPRSGYGPACESSRPSARNTAAASTAASMA